MPTDRDDSVFAPLADPDLDPEQDELWEAAMAVDQGWHGDGLAFPHQGPLTTALARLDAPLGRLGDALTRALDGVAAAGRGRRPLTLLPGPAIGAGGRTRVVAAVAAGLLTATAVGSLLSTNGAIPTSSDDAPVAAAAPATDDDGRLLEEPAVLIPPTAISRSDGSPDGPQGAEVAVGGSSGGAPRVTREAEGDRSSRPDVAGGPSGDGTAVLGSSTGGAPPSGTPSPGHASPSGDGGAPSSGGAPTPAPSGAPDGGSGDGSGNGDDDGSTPEPTTPSPTEPAPTPTSTPPPTAPPPPPPAPNPVCQLLPLLCPGGGLIP